MGPAARHKLNGLSVHGDLQNCFLDILPLTNIRMQGAFNFFYFLTNLGKGLLFLIHGAYTSIFLARRRVRVTFKDKLARDITEKKHAL